MFEATQCSGPDFGGECDLAAIAGIFYALCAMAFAIVVIIMVEVVWAVRRRRQRSHLDLRLG